MSFVPILKAMFSPYGIMGLCLVILLIGKVFWGKNYLNCFDIIKKHLNCFESRKGRMSYVSVFLYVVVPFLLAIAVVRLRNIDADVINLLTIIISILTAMFFTLLTLILDMRGRVKNDKEYDAGDALLSMKLLKEVYYSIMFEILLSVVILIMCFIELFTKQFYWACSLIIYYISFVVLLNLFMVLKRIFKVIDEDLKDT